MNGEIINADSMQMYKGLDQITNKHPLKERKGIAHHVMNHVNWDEEYHIHKFAQDANRAIDDIHLRNKVPIIVGGTHYYLLSLLFENKTIGATKELELMEQNGSTQINELTPEQILILDGPVDQIFDTLQAIDPVIAEKFHPKDKRKLRRALEIYYTTNKKTSDIYLEQKLDELEDSSLRFNTLVFWVYSDSEVLRPRLDTRVDKMMDLGAVEEIRELYKFYQEQSPEKPDLTTGIWQVIGFKEFWEWLETGAESDFQSGVEKMKIRTRQYAKSQVKWIKKLLATELVKEARFNYKYGGKMYLLDATDLSKWKENVFEVGEKITNQFLASGPASVTHPQAPESFKDIFPTAEYVDNRKSNKKIGAESDWKHFKCDICKDKNGNPFVAIGEEQFKIHTEGRRHKRQLGAKDKKRKHEEYMAANKSRKAEVVGVTATLDLYID